MKIVSSLKISVLAVLAAFGLTAAHADTGLTEETPAPVTSNLGLLGQSYATLSYSYIDLDGISQHADDYAIELTKPLAFGLDGVLSYDYAQASAVAGARATQQTLGAAIRAFSTSYNWGKPYVEVGAGYTWTRYAGTKDNSFVWEVAAGAEFQVRPAFTVTPYVRYADAPDLPGSGTWNFGVKGNYWVNTQWAVTAGLERDDDQNTMFTIGTNFRF